jgi:hypothetical protein
MTKKIHITICILIILSNIYFLYVNVFTIIEKGGPFGFGIMFLPFTIIPNLFLISSINVLRKKDYENTLLLIINTFGITYCVFILAFLFINFT